MLPSATPQSLHQTPDSAGFFGAYGGVFVPPGLEGPLAEIRQAYEVAMKTTDQVASAQAAVYARTTELIRDYFCLSGLRRLL